MNKTLFGAALFFIGFGIFFTLLVPMESFWIRLIVSVILMIVGYKIGSGC
ncbi:MAG: hypothetical protein ACI4DV_00790 [Lachnospiraceae bacterium]